MKARNLLRLFTIAMLATVGAALVGCANPPPKASLPPAPAHSG
ncbi:MAG TPA: hypothetical protein VHD32_18500 [Candidatus Didemnitutus sp.]|nr:hypothetical protein [Candidatus Didemnitutus sp.]